MTAREPLSDSLPHLSFLISERVGRIAARWQLSLVQVRLLGILRDRQPGVNELAAHLGLDKSSVSGLIDRAERRGLVERVGSDADRRVVRVSSTAAGRGLAEDIRAEVDADLTGLTGTLTPTQREEFGSLVAHVIDQVERAR